MSAYKPSKRRLNLPAVCIASSSLPKWAHRLVAMAAARRCWVPTSVDDMTHMTSPAKHGLIRSFYCAGDSHFCCNQAVGLFCVSKCLLLMLYTIGYGWMMLLNGSQAYFWPQILTHTYAASSLWVNCPVSGLEIYMRNQSVDVECQSRRAQVALQSWRSPQSKVHVADNLWFLYAL